MHGCISLSALPDTIGGLTSLENLDISGPGSSGYFLDETGSANRSQMEESTGYEFVALSSLPDSLGDLSSLTALDLSYTVLTHLNECVGRLPKLKRLNLAMCIELEEVCQDLPKTLEQWTLNCCYKLKALPQSVSGLTSLQNLSLNDLGLWDAHARVIASGLRGSSVKKLDLRQEPAPLGEPPRAHSHRARRYLSRAQRELYQRCRRARSRGAASCDTRDAS